MKESITYSFGICVTTVIVAPLLQAVYDRIWGIYEDFYFALAFIVGLILCLPCVLILNVVLIEIRPLELKIALQKLLLSFLVTCYTLFACFIGYFFSDANRFYLSLPYIAVGLICTWAFKLLNVNDSKANEQDKRQGITNV